jgi:hypothetical protein
MSTTLDRIKAEQLAAAVARLEDPRNYHVYAYVELPGPGSAYTGIDAPLAEVVAIVTELLGNDPSSETLVEIDGELHYVRGDGRCLRALDGVFYRGPWHDGGR